MNTRSNISKTIASSWMSLMVISACQLLMIPIALGALSKVDFALFAVITQMLAAIMLAEMGVRSACARLLIDARAKGDEAYDKMWMASICVFCVQSLVMLLLILGLAPFIENIFHLDAEQKSLGRSIFLVVGIINTINYALSVFSTALLAGQRLSKVNMITAIYGILQLIVFSIAIHLGSGLWSYPIALFAAVVCSQSLMIRQVFHDKLAGCFSVKLVDKKEIVVVMKLGLDVFIAAVFSVVMGNSLLIFSGHLLTLEETAILAVNLKLVNMMTQVLQRVPGSASPMLMKMVSEGDDSQFRLWWKLITKMTIGLALICAGMFIIWNRLVVTLWTSEAMVLSLGSVMLLSLIPFRYLIHYQFVNSLTIFKEIRKVKWMLGWEVILYGTLAWWLGNQYGLIGLLSANLLSMLGGSLFFGMRWFSKYASIPFRELVSLLVRLVIPLGLSFVVVYLCGLSRLNRDLWGSLEMSALWLVLFSGVGYFIILDKADRTKFQRVAGGLRKKIFKRRI